jgi:hypothetical protein
MSKFWCAGAAAASGGVAGSHPEEGSPTEAPPSAEGAQSLTEAPPSAGGAQLLIEARPSSTEAARLASGAVPGVSGRGSGGRISGPLLGALRSARSSPRARCRSLLIPGCAGIGRRRLRPKATGTTANSSWKECAPAPIAWVPVRPGQAVKRGQTPNSAIRVKRGQTPIRKVKRGQTPNSAISAISGVKRGLTPVRENGVRPLLFLLLLMRPAGVGRTACAGTAGLF